MSYQMQVAQQLMRVMLSEAWAQIQKGITYNSRKTDYLMISH